MSQKRDNSGSLSRNTRKEKDTHPDVSGSCVIGGKEYWISGWRKENDKGPWTSLAFKPKEAPAAEAPKAPPKAQARAWEDD